MSYRWVEHTAELELAIDALTEEAVFADALGAIAELLTEEEPAPRPPGEELSLEISLAGTDRALLLADWLDELLFRAETEGLLPRALERIALDEQRLGASVRFARTNPRNLVKGVTHHRLSLAAADDGFHATVVLDV